MNTMIYKKSKIKTDEKKNNNKNKKKKKKKRGWKTYM